MATAMAIPHPATPATATTLLAAIPAAIPGGHPRQYHITLA